MLELSAQRILEAWEFGAASAPEVRTRTLLKLATPELPMDAIKDMVIGERNKNLFELRQSLFGSALQAYIECGGCGEALDLEFSIEDFEFAATIDTSESYSVSSGAIQARVRLPNGNDLTALASASSVEEGRQILFSLCVLKLQRNNVEIDVAELEIDELSELEAEIAELDPRMEILFDVHCPSCSHCWQSPLQLDSFLWQEFDSYARQLLENVHLLANHYGWSEQDILAMSHVRRQHYIKRLLQ